MAYLKDGNSQKVRVRESLNEEMLNLRWPLSEMTYFAVTSKLYGELPPRSMVSSDLVVN